MTLTYGALCAGVGGLEMGVQSVLGGDLAWYSEFDPGPSKVMAHHHPDVPNIGDMTKVDWHSVPRVDVLAGGTPCQDLSHAGKRAGMTEGTRSNLWVQMREAINVIRPRLVVWENVRGALSAEAASELEPCPGCMGDPRDGRVVLRALGRVVGDLASLGYVGSWYGLRAADVGAPHGRFRVFLFATPADANGAGWGEHGRAFAVRPEHAAVERAGAEADLTLLPTPAVNDMGAAYTPETWDAWTAKMQAAHGNGNGNGKSLAIEAQRLLPTPVSDNSRGLPSSGTDYQSLGDYAPAIARWEALTRPAPAPTEPGAKGSPRLSPKFVEFLMGLPEGHVTDPAIGLTRNQQLKALGNGVVWQQCAAATRAFMEDTAEAVAS